MKRYAILMTLVALLCSCSRDNTINNASPVKIHRLDLALANGNCVEIDSMKRAAIALFDVIGAGDVTDEAIHAYAADRAVTFYTPDIERYLPSLDSVERAIGGAYINLATMLPDAPRLDIYAVVLPYNQSIFFKDSMMFVGLNHYLGAGYEPYTHFPDYRRRLKTPSRLPIDITEAAISVGYPFAPTSDYPTALSRMLYEGAVVEALMQVSAIDEATALGYDTQQWRWLSDNEARIWEALITRKLLYSTDPVHIRSLVDPAPFTSIINAEVPGRAGRYIGHRIISSYLRNNPSATLEQLLSPSFYMSADALASAAYRP